MGAQDRVNEVAAKHGGGNGRGPSSAETLHDLLNQQRDAIAKALPRHMDPDRAIRLAWNAIRTNKKLLECSQVSVLSAVMEASQLGLEIDGVLGHAYLIPRKNKWTKRLEANFQIGYRGLIALAHRAGDVGAVNAAVVHSRDTFDFCEGTESYVRHKRSLTDRGERIAAWCVASMRDGGHVFRVLGSDDIERARRSSMGGDVWEQHTDEMWRKTAVRQTLKYVPLSPDILAAVALDEARDAGVEVPLALPDGTQGETVSDMIDTEAREEAPVESGQG